MSFLFFLFSCFLFVSTNVHVVKHVFMSLCVNVYKSISANSFKWLSMCMNLCTCRCFILSTKTHINTHRCVYTHIQPLAVLSLFSFSIVNTNTHTHSCVRMQTCTLPLSLVISHHHRHITTERANSLFLFVTFNRCPGENERLLPCWCSQSTAGPLSERSSATQATHYPTLELVFSTVNGYSTNSQTWISLRRMSLHC